MGYNLYIGEAVADVDLAERYARVGVNCMTVEGAPLNSTDDYINRVFPSYSVWAQFAREVGLYELFYAKSEPWWQDDEGMDYEGLLSRHPGAVKITEGHYRAFVQARERYIGRPDRPARLPEHEGLVPQESTSPGRPFLPENLVADEYNVKRLNWLVFWTRWALDNCKYPTFANS